MNLFHTYTIRVREHTDYLYSRLRMLYSRWQIFRSAGGDVCICSTVYTRLQGDVTVPVGDTSTILRRVLSDNGATCRFFFTLVVDEACLYVGSTNFTFVEYCSFRDVDTVESAVVEDAAVTERGEWGLFVVLEVAVDEDAAVTELDEVGQCGVLEDGAVGEAATRAEATTIFYLSVFSYIPLGELV